MARIMIRAIATFILMEDQDFRNFLETSRDFHRWLSKHNRNSAYMGYVMAAGMAAVTGFGLYIVESDAAQGYISHRTGRLRN